MTTSISDARSNLAEIKAKTAGKNLLNFGELKARVEAQDALLDAICEVLQQ